jgi:nitrogen regulatory protein P-II 1
MKQVKVICRKECVAAVAAALRQSGTPRLTISHVHALGSGVDPEHYRMSLEEEAAYTEKAKLELVCQADDVDRVIDLVRQHAKTGQRGDGVIFVSDVERVVKIRTGDENALALL